MATSLEGSLPTTSHWLGVADQGRPMFERELQSEWKKELGRKRQPKWVPSFREILIQEDCIAEDISRGLVQDTHLSSQMFTPALVKLILGPS